MLVHVFLNHFSTYYFLFAAMMVVHRYYSESSEDQHTTHDRKARITTADEETKSRMMNFFARMLLRIFCKEKKETFKLKRTTRKLKKLNV